MDLRCIECARDLRDKVMITRIGDIDAGYCDGCDTYYDKKEIKDLIFSR